jgi:predicted amidohydrolase YtcJ
VRTVVEKLSGLRKSGKSSQLGKRKKRKSPSSIVAYPHPTQILLNGNIVTLDESRPSAQAIAVYGDRIVAVGESGETQLLAGPETSRIDLRGATVLPGFIDTHVHLIEYGLSLSQLDLRNVRGIEELKKLVSSKARQASPWVLGLGWDQEKFSEKRYPHRQDLDEPSPDKPVMLRRVCGHICVVNSKALEIAHVDSRTSDPEGGVIDRDTAGEPTGILRETAVELIERKIPDPTLEDYENATLAACQRAAEAGLTSVHCILDSELELRALLRLRKKGQLSIRFYVLIPASHLKSARQLGLSTGFGDEWIRLGAVKIFTDGSLGARTAALKTPYTDDPSNRGVTIYTQEQLDQIIQEAEDSDFQIAVHAIGDRAIGMLLESVTKPKSIAHARDLRPRIEHASVLNLELIKRLKEQELIVTVQPHFVVSDFWTEERLGPERTRLTYPFSSLLKAGLMVVGSSDCPVEPLTPLSGIGAAVDRQGPEALRVEDAVALYTRNAAYASFEENLKGSITPGKYADLVILERDPRKISPSKISEIAVLMTMVGGKIVYRSPTFR